jgi:hypothetical protein
MNLRKFFVNTEKKVLGWTTDKLHVYHVTQSFFKNTQRVL